MKLTILPLLLLLLLLLLPASLAADISPKGFEYLKLRVIQSGSMQITGSVSVMNLTVYVPQEGIESMDISADSWRLITDEFGNDILLLEWENPKGLIEYRVDVVVNNNANHVYSKGAIGNDPLYLKETDTIVFNDEIMKLAYPFEKSLERAAELTIMVNEMVSYDESLAGEKKPSDWVLANRRGVCAEFSNLLTSLLRLNNIPTSYVVGYSYSELDKQFIGHAWVEVLMSNGEWVALDPTWLEAGYMDATHVKIANLPDSNHTEILSYRGSGDIRWIQDEKEFEILDYTRKNITDISLESEDFAGNGYGYLKAGISSNECRIATIKVSSCIGNRGTHLFDIYDNQRNFFFCQSHELYWVFNITAENYAFYCPVVVYDQIGSRAEKSIRVEGTKSLGNLFISGPNTIGINEQFQLQAGIDSDEFLFFSPDLGKNTEKEWTLSVDRPGTYNFYLYSDGSLATKQVTVAEEREFSVGLLVPDNVTEDSFLAEVTIENLLNRNKQAVVRMEFNEQSEQQSLSFLPRQTRQIIYNLSADAGLKKLKVLVMSDTITSNSASVLIYKETSWLDDFFGGITSFFMGIAEAIGDLFSSIFSA